MGRLRLRVGRAGGSKAKAHSELVDLEVCRRRLLGVDDVDDGWHLLFGVARLGDTSLDYWSRIEAHRGAADGSPSARCPLRVLEERDWTPALCDEAPSYRR